MVNTAAIGIYVINLDRVPSRLARLERNLASHGLDFVRVPGVDGRGLPHGSASPLNRTAFERDNGRRVLPGEVGCYMSHLKALAAIEAGAQPFGVILEDDVAITDRFSETVQALTTVEHWDVVKLVNHRTKMFRVACALPGGVRIGRCLHGPGGSAAAYMVRRSSAAALSKTLVPMCGPYDVELEAGWRTRMAVYCTDTGMVDIVADTQSQIGKRRDYREARFAWRDRSGALRYRAREILARAAYVSQLADEREALWLRGAGPEKPALRTTDVAVA